jgi:nucleoid-associated protein YgaU
MPTGTKIAAIVLVVLLGAAGLYFAFVAPSTPHATDDHKESGPSSLNDSSNPPTLPPSGANANGLGTGTTPGATNPTGTANGMSNLEQLARNNANAGTGVGTTTGGVNTGVNTGTTTGTGSTVFPPSTTPNTSNGATAPAGSTVGSAGTPPTFNGMTRSGSSIPGGSLAAGGTNTGLTGGTTSGNTTGNTSGNATGNTATGSSSDTASKPVVAKSNSDATKTTGEHTHIVTKGETFASIAKSELGSAGKWEMIAKANPNVKADALKIGTKLRIPSAASGTLAAGDGKIERSSGSTSAPGKALASNASTSSTTSGTTSGTTSHVVASGETMSSIAKAIYGNSKFWKAIAKANPTVDPDAMKAGQKLNIPSKTTVVGAENVEPASSR